MKFLSIVGALKDNSLGSMSCSGGEASLVADFADRLEVNMPALSCVVDIRVTGVVGRASQRREPTRLSPLHLG